MNNLQLASSVLVDPRAAFEALDRQPRFWFALLAPALAHVAVVLWHFGVVDYAWLTDELVSATPQLREMTPEQQAQAMPPREVRMWSTIALVAIGLPLLRVLEAVYFSLAGTVANVQRSFRHWLALASWSSFPYVLAVLAMTIPLLMQDGDKTTQEGLSVLSLNQLAVVAGRGGRAGLERPLLGLQHGRRAAAHAGRLWRLGAHRAAVTPP